MSLESFYGGKPGISPVIKKSFKYVNERDPAYVNKTQTEKDMAVENNEVMETCFAKSNYTDVWYGELAIIDAENRNNPNHGRLYRRILKRDKASDPNTNHAEYIGTLAGPAGGFPQTNIVKFKSFKTDVDQHGVSYIYPSSSCIEEGTYDNFRKGVQEQTWRVSTDLVPGKDENDNYNDEVKYYWVNVVNNTDKGEEKNTIYLGFKIPYPVFDFDIEPTDWTNDFSAERIDEQDHPFYTNTKLSIPIGVKGNSVGNFRKETIEENGNPVYKYDDFYFNKQGLLMIDEDEKPIHSNGNKVTPINSNNKYKDKQAWVYECIAYGKFSEKIFKKEFTCYLGTVEEIENIQITDEGIIQVKYLNEDYISINNDNPIKYIKDITYDDTTYEAIITYNTEKNDENETKSFIVPGIKGISINNENGKISYIMTDDTRKESAQSLEFVTGITIADETKEVLINKTTNPEEHTKTFLQSIEKTTFDNNTGNLTIQYNTRKDGKPFTETIENFRPPLKSAEIAAGLYTGLLRAIAILQEEYYDPEHIDKNLLNEIKNIETTSPSFSTVEAIVRGDWNSPKEEEGNLKYYQSFWFLEKKYFADSVEFDNLKNELNLECKKETDESGNEIENSEYFDFYPYDKGNISFFATKAIPWNDLEDEQTKHNTALKILKLRGKQDPNRTGQLLYYKSNAFYYDYNMTQWNYAGTWSSAADKSHIQILQYDINGNPKPIKTNFNLSDAGFYFEQRQVSSDQEAGILLGEFSNENQTI